MDLIQFFFNNINRKDITKNSDNLFDEGKIDSIDIIALIGEIEKYYNKPLNSSFINVENFKNFDTIKTMLEEAYE
ncbi:acyl carrier protein [Campylobacter lari]|uniref:acyl carrier protein n=1 Tax=Campylobacter TaxID=194 RepID=UPI000B3FEBBB|nr:acyl carrier protein [Campylobacter lari]MCR6528524.1 acyl carrier protein [Campylobacter lari]MCR6557953.1 acyl carrier protein [Campylobacter lari]